jgi:hypothetical protein
MHMHTYICTYVRMYVCVHTYLRKVHFVHLLYE